MAEPSGSDLTEVARLLGTSPVTSGSEDESSSNDEAEKHEDGAPATLVERPLLRNSEEGIVPARSQRKRANVSSSDWMSSDDESPPAASAMAPASDARADTRAGGDAGGGTSEGGGDGTRTLQRSEGRTKNEIDDAEVAPEPISGLVLTASTAICQAAVDKRVGRSPAASDAGLPPLAEGSVLCLLLPLAAPSSGEAVWRARLS